MSHSYRLTPHESVVVREASAELLEVEVTYPGGQAPLPHFHPAQDERFEVLSGGIRARVDRIDRELRAGDVLEIPRGAVHRIANAGESEARAIWRTTPAGRTLEWFSVLDEIQRSGRVGKDGMPGLLEMGVLLSEYDDVMRLGGGPQPVVRAGLGLLARLGRLRGYRVATA